MLNFHTNLCRQLLSLLTRPLEIFNLTFWFLLTKSFRKTPILLSPYWFIDEELVHFDIRFFPKQGYYWKLDVFFLWIINPVTLIWVSSVDLPIILKLDKKIHCDYYEKGRIFIQFITKAWRLFRCTIIVNVNIHSRLRRMMNC